jgi:hypothetical protein
VAACLCREAAAQSVAAARPPPPRRFLRPLYRALSNSKSAAARQLALDTFLVHRPNYHPIAGGAQASSVCGFWCCRSARSLPPLVLLSGQISVCPSLGAAKMVATDLKLDQSEEAAA